MDGSAYVRAQMLIDGLHGALREIHCSPALPKQTVDNYSESPISSRWQELRAKFKSVETSSASAIPLSPLSNVAIKDISNYKFDRVESMASPLQKKPTTSRQLLTASPVSQKTSVLNKEAERLLER